jgi:hypothetical protein
MRPTIQMRLSVLVLTLLVAMRARSDTTVHATSRAAAQGTRAPQDSVVRDVAGRWMHALMARDFKTAAAMTSLPFVVADEGKSLASSCRTVKQADQLPRVLGCLQTFAAGFEEEWTGLSDDWSDYPINVRVPFLPGDQRPSARSVGFFTSNDCPVRVLVAVAARAEGVRVVGISLVQLDCIDQPPVESSTKHRR